MLRSFKLPSKTIPKGIKYLGKWIGPAAGAAGGAGLRFIYDIYNKYISGPIKENALKEDKNLLVKDKFEQSKLFNQLAEALKSINVTEKLLPNYDPGDEFTKLLQDYFSANSIRFFNNPNTLDFVNSMIDFISQTRNFVNYDSNYGMHFLEYIKRSLVIGKTLTEIDADLKFMLEKSIYPSYILFRLKGELNNANLVLILQTFGKADEKILKDFANIEKESTLLYGDISEDFNAKIWNERYLEKLAFGKNLAENKIYDLLIPYNIRFINTFSANIAKLLGCRDLKCLGPYINASVVLSQMEREIVESFNQYNAGEVYKPFTGKK